MSDDELNLNSLIEMLENIKKMMEDQGKTENDDYTELCTLLRETKMRNTK